MGYIGLIMIVFESRQSTRINLRKADFTLSMIAADTSVVFPIGLSYLFLFVGFGCSTIETFIIKVVPSATSLGTTFAVIASAYTTVDLGQVTCIGAVLVGAAVIDDFTRHIINPVIHDLGQPSSGGDVKLG